LGVAARFYVFNVLNIFATLLFQKRWNEWHIRVIKDQIKMTFLLLCDNVDKRYEPISIVPRQ